MERALDIMSFQVASSFDLVFSHVLLEASGAAEIELLGPRDRVATLQRFLALYDRERFLREPDAFFAPPPPPMGITQSLVAKERGGETLDMTWSSGYRPFCRDIAEEYLCHELNCTAAARLFLHERRRRHAVILIHGYLGGAHVLEQRVWPVRWLFESGLDVALAVLPFHGVRGARRFFARPTFPNSDPRLTVEGFRQAIHDLRSLIRWFREDGAESVGVMGMSLGGYTAALLSTVERDLSFVVPFIPLASIADFAKERGKLTGTPEEQAEQHRLLDAVHRVVSPLARPTHVPARGRLVIAAAADRITPVSHAQRLAQHLSAPLDLFEGGHLLQLGRRRGFRAVGRMLNHLGLLPRRR